MTAADLSFWQKLWNKGVDIAAGILTGTITAGIIAGIATLTWWYKRKRDLELDASKQRQQHTIAKELADQDAATKGRDRLLSLQRELEVLIEAFSSAGSSGNANLLQDAWDAWLKWLTRNQLEYVPENQRIISSWARYSGNFRGANSPQTVSQWVQRLVVQIRETRLAD